MFNQLFHTINDIAAVRILYAAKQSLDIITVKDGHIDKGSLVDAHERLIEAVDKLLEALFNVILWVFDDVTAFAVFFPEVICPNQDIGDAHSAGAAIAHVADILDYIIHEGGEVFWRLIVIVFQEEKPFCRQSGQVIGIAIRQIGGS